MARPNHRLPATEGRPRKLTTGAGSAAQLFFCLQVDWRPGYRRLAAQSTAERASEAVGCGEPGEHTGLKGGGENSPSARVSGGPSLASQHVEAVLAKGNRALARRLLYEG